MTQKIIQQGAEAVILLEDNLAVKDRIKKSYRIKELDEKIRKQRTKREKNLLEKASKIINAPDPLPLKEWNIIKMPFIEGKKLSECLDSFDLEKQKDICRQVGKDIAKLHDADIIHGDLTTSNMILVEGVKEDNSKFKKNLSILKKLKLPTEEYALFGSSPLAIHGIRDSEDIDIIVKTRLWDELVKKYPPENEKLIKIKSIEIYKNWLPWIDDINKLINDAEIIGGVRFVKLNYVLDWKKAFGREKDIKDIQLIEQYLKRGDNKFQIFFIDFGLGYISKKIEDKAVDLHLLKQALEARHFRNWEVLFKEILKGYEDCKESNKILERFRAVEKRGRYKEH